MLFSFGAGFVVEVAEIGGTEDCFTVVFFFVCAAGGFVAAFVFELDADAVPAELSFNLGLDFGPAVVDEAEPTDAGSTGV